MKSVNKMQLLLLALFTLGLFLAFVAVEMRSCC